MKNNFMCIPISELLENSGCTAIRGVYDEQDVWILQDNQQKTVAYQVFEEGRSPFDGVYCLLEMHSRSLDLAQELPIRGFLTGI